MSGGLDHSVETQLTKVARGGAINLVGAVFSSLGGFILVIIVTNNVDANTAGRLFSATSVFLILTALSSLGTETGLARYMLRLEARSKHADIMETIRIAAVPVAVTSVVMTVIMFVGAGVIAPRIGLSGPGGSSMLHIAVVFIPIAATSEFALALTRAFGRMRPTAVIDSIGRVSLQAVLLFIVTKVSTSPNVLTAAWLLPYVPTAILATTTCMKIVRRRRSVWPEDLGSPRTRQEISRGFWRFTWARGFAAVFQIAIQRLDIVLIAALIGASHAAVYTAATRFVVLGQFTGKAIQQVLQPRFSQLLANDDHSAVRDVFKIATAWSMTLSWPIYLLTACAAPLYLSIFGKGYESAGVGVVVIMAVSMMFAIAAGALDTLLLMAGGSTASLVNMITAAVVNIGGCVLLIPRHGIYGAALSWGAAIVVRNTLTFVQVYKLLKVTPWSRSAGLVAIACGVCFGLPTLALQANGSLNAASFFVVLAAGALVYVGFLWHYRSPLALTALRGVIRSRVAT